MTVKRTKTKVMAFGKDDTNVFSIYCNNLEIINEYNYLGVVINSAQCSKGNIFTNMVT